jgi:quinoprotein glucose dehydrogenase
MLRFVFLRTAAILALSAPIAATAQQASSQWPTYGGDPGGQRYSAATQIDRSNVQRLKPAWTFHTGSVRPGIDKGQEGAFEATPIVFKDKLYLSSPHDEVFALNPETGASLWYYNPHIRFDHQYGLVTSRGVASWSDGNASQQPCADRIFVATLDARLIAVDAADGKPCAGFGANGAVDLTVGVDYRPHDDYFVTSPPTVVGDVVVVGSGIADNFRVDVERGDVRGFDARTGKLVWTWQPMPWAEQQKLRTGGGNTWSVIAADLEHGLVYLPTSSPSPDYYGGLRPGNNADADSIVALDAKTGKKVWAYQLIHHNLWDYDLASEPLLFDFRGRDGKSKTPAVAVATKMGMVFVFNRLTGEPLWPITERAVPQSDVPGEQSSPTQPFSALPPLNPLTLDTSKPLGLTPADDAVCRKFLTGLRYEGIYTPPSLRGSIMFPSNVGGVNWGSTAFDPASGILYANTNRLPYIAHLRKPPFLSLRTSKMLAAAAVLLVVALIVFAGWRTRGVTGAAVAVLLLLAAGGGIYKKRASLKPLLVHNPWLGKGGVFSFHFGKELGLDSGAPYEMMRQPILTDESIPCGPTPFGALSALNLNTGQTAFQTPLGTLVAGQHTGTWSVGGPMVTAGGLVFTAASTEPYLRAFDASTGQEIWKDLLPVPAQATPMTFVLHDKQYVVISAGGHSSFGTAQSDAVVAYTLDGR